MRRIVFGLILGYLATAACAQPAGTFSGRVVAALDGDSMRILRDGREVEVRLHGVDAPEGGQAFGDESRRFLSQLIRGKTVSVDVRDVDQYDRLVARVRLDGTDVGLEVIRSGHGWHYTRYADDRQYAEAEREARQASRGLWTGQAPIAPWEFRARQVERPRSNRAADPGTAPSGPFHGNVESRVFHAPGCEHYRCKACTAVFATREAAIAAGYRPHAACVGR